MRVPAAAALFAFALLAAAGLARAEYRYVAYGGGNQYTHSSGKAGGDPNGACVRGTLQNQIVQFQDNFAAVREEIEGTIVQHGAETLRVYNGGEWQFRLCRAQGVLSLNDLNTVRRSAKEFSENNPHWLIQPGTVLWGNRVRPNADQYHLMNCATVWLNGREVSFHCKKYKNDMAPENVNRNDIWVRELKGNNIPKFFRDINTGTTLDVFANDALAPYPPYSNGGLAGNLGSVGLFQVGALVVGIDICQDHGGGNDCKVDGQVIGRTSRLKCYLRKHPIFSRGVDLLLVSSFGAGASAADSPVRRGGVIVATDSGGGAQNYGMYVLQTNSKWNYNDAMAGIGDQTLNTMYHCASRAWSTANQGGVALFKKAPQGCGWNEAAPAAGRCYNVFARELTLGTANAPVVPNACAGSKWA